MYKSVLFVFLLCFACYLPFSRQPDYFDSEFAEGAVVIAKDRLGQMQRSVYFKIDGEKTGYHLPTQKALTAGQKVKIIYNTGNPQSAAVYSLWGYWFGWQEVLALVIGYFVLLELAKAITSHPHPDAVRELEEEEKKPKIRKPRYNP